MREGPDGSVLDVGRRTRTVPTPVRRALVARDSRCRFPGCLARRCDAHHITHWADGGSTSLDNLMLLCRRHHTLLHEGGIAVERDALGGLTFARPDGRVIEVCPQPPLGSRRALPNTGSAAALRCWDGTRFNLGHVIDVLRVPNAVSKQSERRALESSHATTRCPSPVVSGRSTSPPRSRTRASDVARVSATAHPRTARTSFARLYGLRRRFIAPCGRLLDVLLIRGVPPGLALSRALLLCTTPLITLFVWHEQSACNVDSRCDVRLRRAPAAPTLRSLKEVLSVMPNARR